MLLHLSGHRSIFGVLCLHFHCHRLGQSQERDTKLVTLAQVAPALRRNNEVAINTKLLTGKCN